MIINRNLKSCLRKKRVFTLVILVILILNVYFLIHFSSGHTSGPKLRYFENKRKSEQQQGKITFVQENVATKSEMTGQLNVHIWEDVCDCRLANFRRHLAFPPRRLQNPDTRTTVEGVFQISWGQNSYAQRIFGFIHPPVTGNYKFALSAEDEAELYLSSDQSPEKISLIASVTLSPEGRCENSLHAFSGNYKVFPSQISRELTLEKGGKYFIEVLHKKGPGEDNVEVAWVLPGEKEFELIEEDFMSKFVNENELNTAPFEYEYKIANYNPIDFEHKHQHTKYETPLEKVEFLKMKFADALDFVDVLPDCKDYRPSYLVPKSTYLERYEVYYHHIYHTAHYPNWDQKWQLFAGGSKVFINENHAQNIVKKFMGKVNLKHPGKYTLSEIVNVEMKLDRRKGKRYLIELILKVKDIEEPRRFSEYIFETKVNRSLCYPPDLKWNKTALVNIVATVKNQGHWIKHLITNLRDIMEETGDHNFHLVVFDYESTDYDLEDVLYNSNLPSYSFISQPGLYSRAESFNSAVEVITDPNSIVFTCDLHLDMPRNLFDMLRKHTITNHLAYGPMIIRLGCAATPENPSGFWEWAGFGIFSLTKADWDAIGGYNEKEYKNTWGGEDWEMLDRVARHRLDVERLMFPNFYHYFHTRKKLWGNDLKNKGKKMPQLQLQLAK